MNTLFTDSAEASLAKIQVRQARPIAQDLLARAQAKRQAAFAARDMDAYWFWFYYCSDLAGLCGTLGVKAYSE